jgi:hypothetical protein
MNLLLLLSFFLWLAITALASDKAGPLEMVYFYYAYKIEFATEPDKTKRIIAPGSGPTLLNFDSFVNYVLTPNFRSNTLTGYVPFGGNKFDFSLIDEALADRLLKSNRLKTKLEHPNFFRNMQQQGTKWSDVISTITDNLQDSRTRADAGNIKIDAML